jgi:GTP-binding protein
LIDRVKIHVKGGKGGDGAVRFRREKFVPFGGPDGGDGGDGGSIFLVVEEGLSTLGDLKHQRIFRAENGKNGQGKKKHGRNGGDLSIKVPPGTIVRREEEGQEITVVDLVEKGQKVVVAKGGKGGRGNARFATSTNRAPRIATQGRAGEEFLLTLELKLIADVGLVGFPSVGKSTLLNAVSNAKPEIANYPFTTKEPILGVVELGFRSFVLADIPGLIEGAHEGKGLGHDFLRHIERTRVLIFILNGESQNPLSDLRKLEEELFLFNSELRNRPKIITINKIDLPSVRERLLSLEKQLENINAPLHFISAATREGVDNLMKRTAAILDSLGTQTRKLEQTDFRVFHPKSQG